MVQRRWERHQDDSAALVGGAVLVLDAVEEGEDVLAAALTRQALRDQAVELWAGVLLQRSAHAHDALVRGRVDGWRLAREGADWRVVCASWGVVSARAEEEGAARSRRRGDTVRLWGHVLGSLRVKNPGVEASWRLI